MPSRVAPRRALPLLTWVANDKPYSYTVTPTDREWFIRCLWREGKPQETVGHVLLQRFALLRSQGAKYATLTDFLRAYCQPVNPRWFPNGDKSKAFVRRATARGDTAAADKERDRAAQRVKYASTPISAIRDEFVNLADEILYGRSRSLYPTATDFTMSFAAGDDTEPEARKKAKAFAAQRGLVHVPIQEGHKPGINWFFRGPNRPPLLHFGTTTAKVAVALILLPWGLILWAWKRRKR